MAVQKSRKGTGTVERVLLLRLNSIDRELRGLNTRIDSVHTRIDGADSAYEG